MRWKIQSTCWPVILTTRDYQSQECIRHLGVSNCTFFHMAGGDAAAFFLKQKISNRRFEWFVEGIYGTAFSCSPSC